MPKPTRPLRSVGGLPPRQTIPTDTTTSRLRRDQRPTAPPPAAPPPVATPERVATAGSTSYPDTAGASSLPLYLRLVRKESRLRQDQADQLSREVRRLNQARRGTDGATTGERITDNTLIRVAVDLLLARAGELHGTTEAELRSSLTP